MHSDPDVATSREAERLAALELYLSRVDAIKHLGQVAILQEGSHDVLADVQPRDYQLDAWAAINEARGLGADRALVHMATGLGKTTVAVVDALSYLYEASQENRPIRVCFACHQNSILDQAADRFDMFTGGNLEKGFINRGNDQANAPLVFATMQSLHNRLDDLPPDHFDFIIYDEAHHSQADTFKEVVEYFKPDFQLALTATPNRMDSKEIRDLFGEEVYVKSLEDALTEGHLADVEYHIMVDEAMKKVVDSNFDPKTIKEVMELLDNKSRTEEIARQIIDEQNRLGLAEAKTIIFCDSIEQAEEMAALLNGRSYHSRLSPSEQASTLDQFRSNGLKVITTRDMFNEGVDIPDARLVVFLRATGSRTVFEQQLGRGLRQAPGKDKVTVLDFVGNIERLELIAELAERLETAREGTAREGSGLIIHAAHGDFDFEKITVDLLAKLEILRGRYIKWSELSDEEIILKALELSPDKPLDVDQISMLSKNRLFPHVGTITRRFSSMRDFQEKCGFKIFSKLTEQELIAEALRISPDKPLTLRDVTRLSSEGLFVGSGYITKHFGSMTDFQRRCGFEVGEAWVKTKYHDMENEELIAEALRISPDKPLSAEDIKYLSKTGNFIGLGGLRSRFGSLANFKKACGFEDPKLERAEITAEEIIDEALLISPDKPLTFSVIRKLSQEGKFYSNHTIVEIFGSLGEFKKACGFEASKKIDFKTESNEDLIERAVSLSPDKPLSQKDINKLSQQGVFVSAPTIASRFGSIREFHAACGFKVVDFGKMSNEEIIMEALRISPDKPLAQREVNEYSRNGIFISWPTIIARFGSIENFRKLTWTD
jgi:superfamily II DNA or RNA helicase